MELPNHRGLEEKLGKLRSCPGPLVWPLPAPKHPGPTLPSSHDSSDGQSRGDEKEEGTRDRKPERQKVPNTGYEAIILVRRREKIVSSRPAWMTWEKHIPKRKDARCAGTHACNRSTQEAEAGGLPQDSRPS